MYHVDLLFFLRMLVHVFSDALKDLAQLDSFVFCGNGLYRTTSRITRFSLEF